jgi:hypothetical protein
MNNPQKVHNILKGNHRIWFGDDCIQTSWVSIVMK